MAWQAIAAPIAGALIGGFMGMKGAEAQADAQREATAFTKEQFERGIGFFEAVDIPTMEELKTVFTPLELSDFLANPVDYSTEQFKRGPTAMEGIEISPEVLAAQRDTLNTMEEVSREGYTAQEKADMTRGKMDIATTEQGQRQAIMQQMQQRGMGGSGAELASKLLAQQGGANRMAQRGMDVQALGKARALQALQAKGQLAGQMRGQEFGEKRAVATAQDAIGAFNQGMALDTYLANKERLEKAETKKQSYTDVNILDRRTKDLQEKDDKKWITTQGMTQAAGMAGVGQSIAPSIASSIAQEGANQSRLMAGIGETVVRGGEAIGKYYDDEEKKKKGII